MSLPAQLQEQIDAAKAISKQLYGAKAVGEPAVSAPGDSQSEGTAVADEPAKSAAEQEPVAAPAASAPETRTEAPTQREEVTQPESENSDTYAQRWRSLQGVYGNTKRQLDEAQARIANLEQLFSQMQTASVEKTLPKGNKHVTDAERETYGEDMVEFARRVAREESAPLADAVKLLMGKLEQLQGVVPTVQNVAAAQAKTAHDAFYDKLTARIPSWKTVNDDPKFHSWLLSTDPLSGLERQTLLVDAHNGLDLERVVNIFRSGMDATGLQAPQVQAAPAKPSNVSRLERQVAPGRAASGTTPPTDAVKRQWARGDIANFFAAKQRGEYKGREAEAQALERDIFTAQREGRIAQNAA